MWKPQWLYDWMPAIYALAGLVCLALLGLTPATVTSAVALAAAGALIVQARRSHRRPRAGRRHAARRGAPARRPALH